MLNSFSQIMNKLNEDYTSHIKNKSPTKTVRTRTELVFFFKQETRKKRIGKCTIGQKYNNLQKKYQSVHITYSTYSGVLSLSFFPSDFPK